MAKKPKHEKHEKTESTIDIEVTDETTASQDTGGGNPEAITEDSELETAKKAAAENLDKYRRTLAEFDNFRKRTMKEKASMYDDGVRDTIEKLLPVIDNFERALAAADMSGDFEKGIGMIFKQLQDFLESLNISVIDTVGFDFDPNFHNAVAHIQDENFGDNEITEELQKGYIYKDKVIRHSMVKVAN